MGLALEVEGVDQTFHTGFWMRKVQVLHGVQLSVPENSIFGFLGENGAGKTTLIHLITGLRKPSKGRVRVLGNDASSVEAKMALGYLPERPYFHDHLTGEGLLRYFGALAGMERSDVDRRIPEVLQSVQMWEARNLELRRYSKGMLQRIGIAQALVHNPKILILDEPMSGLDPLGRKEMRELIVRLAAEGKTVFFSSHVIPDVEAICDQVALIQEGRLIGCGPIGQFLAQGPLQTEIAFSGGDTTNFEQWSEFVSLRRIPDGWRGIVSGQSSVESILSQLLKARAKILWVNPIRPSLENLFSKKGEKKE